MTHHPVPGFDNTWINENGELIVLIKGLLVSLKSRVSKRGYIVFNSKGKTISQHRAMMLAFRFCKNHKQLQIDHIDGNKTNNRLDNLRWCSAKENVMWGVALRNSLGIPGNRAKLTKEQVLDIRMSNETSYVLGAKYGVHPTTISRARSKKQKSWQWLENPSIKQLVEEKGGEK